MQHAAHFLEIFGAISHLQFSGNARGVAARLSKVNLYAM